MREQRAARLGATVNIVMGLWLFLSSFVWPHDPMARATSMAMGLVIVCVALVARAWSSMSWVDAFPALWLVFAAMVTTYAHSITPWNNAFVGAVVLFASVAPLAAVPFADEPTSDGHRS